jgi:hypothetical protein
LKNKAVVAIWARLGESGKLERHLRWQSSEIQTFDD